MHEVLVDGIELAVDLIELIVFLMRFRVGGKDLFDLDPLFDIRPAGIQADALGSQEGIAIAGADLDLGDLLGEVADIADHLHPGQVEDAAADGDDVLGILVVIPEIFHVVADAVADGFKQGAVHIGAGVAQVEAEEHAAGIAVEDGVAFAGEVGQGDQTVGADGGLQGEFGQSAEGIFAAGFLGFQFLEAELIAEPGGEAAHCAKTADITILFGVHQTESGNVLSLEMAIKDHIEDI